MYLYQNLKYLHFAATFLGVIYLKFDSQSNIPKFRLSRLRVLWYALIWITYTDIHCGCPEHIQIKTNEDIFWTFNEHPDNTDYTECSANNACRIFCFIDGVDLNNIEMKFGNYTSLSVTSVTLLCTIIGCSKQNLLIEALNELAEVDKSQKNMRHLIGNKLTFYASGISMLSIIIGLIPRFLVYRNLDTVNFEFFVDFMSTLIKLLEMSLFLTYLLLLRSRLQILNRQLSNLTKITRGHVLRQPRYIEVLPNSDVKKLRKLRKLHSKLCSICERINGVFSFQSLFLIGVSFMEFTGALYALIDNLKRVFARLDEWRGVTVPLFFITLAKITSLTILCLQCTKTKNEVFRTVDILFEMKSKYEPGVSKEIQRFSRQILHWNLKFTAFDCFDMDMTLIYEIVTTATTYVTILMQFRAGVPTS